MLETLRLKFPSAYPEARKAQDRVIAAIERHAYDDEAVYGIKVAMEEAVINAMKHGNRFDRKKEVLLDLVVDDDCVKIGIEDEGQGFDRATVPDPLADENLERLHGRGLLLMEAYMNNVEYSHGGRRVTLIFYKHNPPKRESA